MKRTHILYGILLVALASCSTQYKSTQTPDDVYFSPAPPADVAKNEKKEDQKNDQDKYVSYNSPEDSYLRMKVANRNRWSSLDDYSYWYDTRYNDYYYNNNTSNYYGYSHGYSSCACSCNGGYTSIFYPGYYNPYIGSFYTGYYNSYSSYPYGNIYVINPKVIHPNVNRPQLGSYSNSGYSNTISTGSSIKKIFSSGNNSSSSNGNYRSTERSYTPSSSSGSSSSGSSSSSSGHVSRPGRH